jgi:small GTP-binding protein domain
MSLYDTSRTDLLHIGIFGKRNSGKSTLINALTGSNTTSISEATGTTTDPVYQTIEIEGIGPCVLIDTAGFDSDDYLNQMNHDKNRIVMQKTDLALIVCSDEDIIQELDWAEQFKNRRTPIVMVINKIDQITNTDKIRNKIHEALKIEPVKISAISRMGIETIREEILLKLPTKIGLQNIIDDLLQEGDMVLLVLPNELQTPVRSLNIPYYEMMKEFLDKKYLVLSCTENQYENALARITEPPKLMIADEKVCHLISDHKPKESTLISFSEIGSISFQ